MSRRLGIALASICLVSPALAQGHVHGAQVGTVHFATSCKPGVAPQFDRAVAWLHSFEFGAAIRDFNGVLAADPDCAMAQWGIALSRWSNPMVLNARPVPLLASGQQAVDAAQRLATNASARERAYIDAVTQLYADYTHTSHASRVAAYERAMATVVAIAPSDTEARIFHALALVAAASPSDKSYKNQRQAGAVLESLWVKQPDHPGLAHYIIHAYDVPALAPEAARAAERYASIAPSAAHALHMPSHTFTRVGMWEASISTNRRSIEAALPEGNFGEALHATDYSVYAYLQLGQDSAARAAVDGIARYVAQYDPNRIVGASPPLAGAFAIAAIPARYALERRAWAEAAALQVRPSAALPWTEAITYFARSLGASHMGDLASAHAAIDSLVAIQRRVSAMNESYWAEQVAIQELGARAWAALAEHRPDSALAYMRAAAAREDATEKAPVTPGPLAPARELLGDMLLELERPAEALAEYRATLTKEPNRFRALYGAMRAASATGDATATTYVAELRKLTASSDARSRPEITQLRRM